MVAAEHFRARWEAERERREIAELEELAAMLLGLFGRGAALRI
jgi:hypothetical protein